jgi:hypothetical protein
MWHVGHTFNYYEISNILHLALMTREFFFMVLGIGMSI